MRGFTEPVEVAHGLDGAPASFVWRGRRYRIDAVLDTWREVLPWWRSTALTPCLAGAGEEMPHAETPSAPVLDRVVWRVEAVPGRMPGRGVYDLVSIGPTWHLERVND